MLRSVLGIAVLVLAVTGCGEKPPRVEPAREQAAALPGGASDPMRERTLSQGESARIYHQ
jgi:predicted small lipoprotein YifL